MCPAWLSPANKRLMSSSISSLTDAHRLVLASAAMLFLELILIRWVGENVVYASYFTNFVLLASFLGIGLGFLAGDWKQRWILHLPYLLFALFALILIFPIKLDRSFTEVLLVGTANTEGIPAWLVLPVVFVASAAVMASIAQEVARIFGLFEPLRAYRLDIIGSICGILLFLLASFLNAPPLVWAGVATVLILIVAGDAIKGPRRLALAGFVFILGVQSFLPALQWSPYYQLTVAERDGVVSIGANGIPHQFMASIEDLREIHWIAGMPYDVLEESNELDNVLIIGAGSGNDVAYALDEGAKHIDAVEIDPVIQKLGQQMHPNAPYDDPAVTVHIDDGRAFLERSDARYDMIVLALTDSLTLISGQSNLRLESYLFTVESVRRATELLSDRGVLAFYNLHSDEWIIARMANTMRAGSSTEVCVTRNSPGYAGVMLATGPGVDSSCLGASIAPTGDLAPPTDDAPFLYVQTDGIPDVYLWSLALILFTSLIGVRTIGGGLHRMAPYADLFLMGVGFLLLETKGVVQFALWFGTTWLVNALVFVGILASIWFAIEVARRLAGRVPMNWLYLTLLASLVVSWIVPPEALLNLPMLPRFVAASTLAFGPVFAANLVFADRFRETSSSTVAFGANLLGAMVGGVLEYLSLITGHRNLVILAGIAYVGAFMVWRRLSDLGVRGVQVSQRAV